MSLKIEFVERAEQGETIAGLCREFGISRQTAHKWLKRFRSGGYDALEDASRRPKSTPLATAEDVVLAVLEAREAHPRWGPRKLHALLARKLRDSVPAARTIARILKRANKVREDRRKAAILSVVERAPVVVATAPNELWSVDFKGWWATTDGERCEPLTVRDGFSRYLLAAERARTSVAATRAVFERLFRKHGCPKWIQSDNGSPFVSTRARGGLTALSAWWVSLGIELVRSRPGSPQDNGGHERMHKDMAADVERYPAADADSQQRAIDRWRQEFNNVRPHEALNNRTPAEVYGKKKGRRFAPIRYAYPASFVLRKVSASGSVKLRDETYFVSHALRGYTIGLQYVDAVTMRAWFHNVDLGTIALLPQVADDVFDLASRRTTRDRRRSAA